ncbi:hypothetical protein MMPV_005331 [Pyropia vietnamensis]
MPSTLTNGEASAGEEENNVEDPLPLPPAVDAAVSRDATLRGGARGRALPAAAVGTASAVRAAARHEAGAAVAAAAGSPHRRRDRDTARADADTDTDAEAADRPCRRRRRRRGRRRRQRRQRRLAAEAVIASSTAAGSSRGRGSGGGGGGGTSTVAGGCSGSHPAMAATVMAAAEAAVATEGVEAAPTTADRLTVAGAVERSATSKVDERWGGGGAKATAAATPAAASSSAAAAPTVALPPLTSLSFADRPDRRLPVGVGDGSGVGGGSRKRHRPALPPGRDNYDSMSDDTSPSLARCRVRRRRRLGDSSAAAAASTSPPLATPQVSQRSRGGHGRPPAASRYVMNGGHRSDVDDADTLACVGPNDPGALPFVESGREEEEEEEEEEETVLAVDEEDEDEDETHPSRRAIAAKASYRKRRGRLPRGGRGGGHRGGSASAGPAAEWDDDDAVADSDDDDAVTDIDDDDAVADSDDDDAVADSDDGPHFSTQPLMFGGPAAQQAFPTVHDEEVWKLLVEALSMGALNPSWTRRRYMAERAHVAAALANVDDRIQSSLGALRAAWWTPAIADALCSRPRVAITSAPSSMVGYVACDACRKWNRARCVVRLAGRRYEAATYWPTPIVYKVGGVVPGGREVAA